MKNIPITIFTIFAFIVIVGMECAYCVVNRGIDYINKL